MASSTGSVSIGGLISGLNVDDIIQKLSDLEKRSTQRYQQQQDTLQKQLSTFQEANTRMLAVRDAASQLATSSFFSQRTATSTSDALTATAAVGASTGDYVVSVESLARAHQQMSQSYEDIDTVTVGTGTLTLTAGGKTTTLQVDSSNNTLRGLRDAINAANGSVRAAIIQDGDASYRLMVSSKETGTANAITLNSSLTGGTGPTFTDLQTAADAKVKLGSGASAIDIIRSTNVVQDLIPGVTLNLVTAEPDTPITVSVGQDKTKIQEGVQKLVDQYNNAVEFVNKQFSFNSDTSQGGTLLGDFTLGSAQASIMQVFTSSVAGVSGGLQSLGDLGVSFDDHGKMVLNTTSLQEKLSSDPDAVARVFALTPQSSNVGVQYVASGTKTKVDGSAYAIEITQAARQARVTAGVAQTGALDADETLTVNGKTITLTSGMTQAQVIAAINARGADTGVHVTATGADSTGSGSFLTFRSVGYGSTAAVSVASSRSSAAGSTTGVGNVAATQASAGGETGSGTGVAGLDVAGTINGEAATGKGQLLSGNADNATTDGLQLRITATTTGSLGTIKLFDGVANAALRTLDSITDAKNGPIHGQEDTLQSRIDYLQKVITDSQDAAQRREDALRAKFNDLEAKLGEFQSQSEYLSSQLRSL